MLMLQIYCNIVLYYSTVELYVLSKHLYYDSVPGR